MTPEQIQPTVEQIKNTLKAFKNTYVPDDDDKYYERCADLVCDNYEVLDYILTQALEIAKGEIVIPPVNIKQAQAMNLISENYLKNAMIAVAEGEK
jgi:hypothetical protein